MLQAGWGDGVVWDVWCRLDGAMVLCVMCGVLLCCCVVVLLCVMCVMRVMCVMCVLCVM